MSIRGSTEEMAYLRDVGTITSFDKSLFVEKDGKERINREVLSTMNPYVSPLIRKDTHSMAVDIFTEMQQCVDDARASETMAHVSLKTPGSEMTAEQWREINTLANDGADYKSCNYIPVCKRAFRRNLWKSYDTVYGAYRDQRNVTENDDRTKEALKLETMENLERTIITDTKIRGSEGNELCREVLRQRRKVLEDKTLEQMKVWDDLYKGNQESDEQSQNIQFLMSENPDNDRNTFSNRLGK